MTNHSKWSFMYINVKTPPYFVLNHHILFKTHHILFKTHCFLFIAHQFCLKPIIFSLKPILFCLKPIVFCLKQKSMRESTRNPWVLSIHRLGYINALDCSGKSSYLKASRDTHVMQVVWNKLPQGTSYSIYNILNRTSAVKLLNCTIAV